MALEPFPFVQAGIPKNDKTAAPEHGRTQRPGGSDNSRFEGLMSEYSTGNAEVHATAAPRQAEQSVPEGKPFVLPQQVLDIMDGQDVPASIPGAIDALSEKAQSLLDMAAEFLGEDISAKLSSLLSSVRDGLKSGKLSGLAPLLDNAADALEGLADALEHDPEAAEDLKGKLAAALGDAADTEAAEQSEAAPAAADTEDASEIAKQPVEDRAEVKKPETRGAAEKSKDAGAEEDPDGEPEIDANVNDIPLAAQAAAGVPVTDGGAQNRAGDAAKTHDVGVFDIPAGMEKTDEPLNVFESMNMANRPELQQAQKGRPQAERRATEPAGQQMVEEPDAAREDFGEPRTADSVARAAQPGEDRGTDGRESGGDGSGGNDGGNNAGTRTENRARADTQRRPGEVRSSGDESMPTERTNAANVRADFQSFFEGVLSSRRTGTTPAPMSLGYGAAALPERSEMLSNGVMNVVRFVRADGLQRANIVIEPPSLGRVTVELTSSTSGVEASIRVSNEQVRQLVQDQISQLRMNLEQQGVQVTQFAVDVQQDNGGQGQNSGQEDRQRGRVRRIGAIEETSEPAEEFRVDLEQGLLHWVA